MRAGELEGTWRRSLREETFPLAQQDWIDDQQDLIRKAVFEQRRCQRRTATEDQVRAVVRFDAANVLDDVRPKALERAPFKAFRPVGRNVFSSLR